MDGTCGFFSLTNGFDAGAVALLDAKKAGVPVRAFRENYFPNQIKEKFLKFLGSDIFKIIEKDPKFETSKLNNKDYIVRYIDEILGSSKLSPETKLAFDHIAKELVKEAKKNGQIYISPLIFGDNAIVLQKILTETIKKRKENKKTGA